MQTRILRNHLAKNDQYQNVGIGCSIHKKRYVRLAIKDNIMKASKWKTTLTFKYKLVGINFTSDESVDICNENIATTIDQLNDLREKTESQEGKRLCSMAITKLEDAQMWAVKALTWSDN